MQPAPLELFVQLPHVGLDGRPFELQAELADAFPEHAAQLRVEGLKCRHWFEL